jgi:hypothetical protein
VPFTLGWAETTKTVLIVHICGAIRTVSFVSSDARRLRF